MIYIHIYIYMGDLHYNDSDNSPELLGKFLMLPRTESLTHSRLRYCERK